AIDVSTVKEDNKRLEKKVDVLAIDVSTVKEDNKRLEKKVDVLAIDVSTVKEDNKRLEKKTDHQFTSLLNEILNTKEDVKHLDQKVDGLQEMVQSLVISVDKLVKAIHDLNTEYAMIKNQTDRHEKWIQEIAGKLGLNLVY
ncbi:hypothetical protein L6252_02565, partial [Candidatus Parcubacteria bacterium]|nr:hypothetical protein [Candidatus Parcubacteria bacterium]